jgi:hypothetical protein
VRDIDVKSIRFAQASVASKPTGLSQISYEDIDGDGTLDLIAKFNTQDLQLKTGSVKAELIAKLVTGAMIKGWGSITVVP